MAAKTSPAPSERIEPISEFGPAIVVELGELLPDAMVGWASLPHAEDGSVRDFARTVIANAMTSGKIKGHRTPESVPANKIKAGFQALLRTGHKRVNLHVNVAECWLAAQTELREAVRVWATENGYAVWAPERTKGRGPRPLKRSELEDVLPRMADALKGIAAALHPFVVWHLLRVPDPADDPVEAPKAVVETQDGDTTTELETIAESSLEVVAESTASAPSEPPVAGALPSLLQGWLEQLALLPADAPEWTALPTFVDATSAIAREREAARKAAEDATREEQRRRWERRDRLDGQLRAIADRIPSALLRQERICERLEAKLAWKGEDFADDAIDALLPVLSGLDAELTKIKAALLRQTSSHEEYRARMMELLDLDAVVWELCLEVDGFRRSTAPVAPQAAASPAGERAPEASDAPAAIPEASYEATPVMPEPQPAPAPQADTLPQPLASIAEAAPLPEPPSQERATKAAPIPAPEPEPATVVGEPTQDTQATQAPVEPDRLAADPAPEDANAAEADADTDEPLDDAADGSDAIARGVLATPASETALQRFLVALVSEADFSGATWVARDLLRRGHDPVLPLTVLEATAGAFALPPEGGEPLIGGLRQLTSAYVPADDAPLAERALALASAIRATETPSAGMREWLRTSVHPLLNDLSRELVSFVDRGMRLPPDASGHPVEVDELSNRRRFAAQEARQWRERADKFSSLYGQAGFVWKHLVVRGAIAQFLEPVLADDHRRVAEVEALLAGWATDDERRERLAEGERELGVPRPIVGPAHRKLMRDAEEAWTKGHQWVVAVRAEQEQAHAGDAFHRLIEKLRRTVAGEQARIEQAIGALRSNAEGPADDAAILTLERALAWLCSRLGLPTRSPPTSTFARDACAVVDQQRSLRSVLSQRLKLLPSVRLTHETDWDDSCEAITRALAEAVARPTSLEAVIGTWIERHDFRFVEELVLKVADDSRQEQLSAQAEASRMAFVGTLRKAIDRLEAKIEQAVIEGVIGPERAEYMAQTVGIREALEHVSDQPYDSYRVQLDELQQKLASARTALVTNYIRQTELLEARFQTDRRPETEPAFARLKAAIASDDIRTIDEMISHLRAVAEGEEYNPELFADPRAADTIERFVAGIADYERDLAAQPRGQLPAALDQVGFFAQGGSRDDYRRACEALFKAARLRPGAGREATQVISDLLWYLGFELHSNQVTVENHRSLVRAAVKASPQFRSAVPAFGSRLHTLVCMVVSEQQGLAALTEAVTGAAAGRESRIVFFAGRLSVAARLSLRSRSLGGAITSLVVDEWMLCFLARCAAEERGPTFLEAALPWTTLNPYGQSSADTAPEMFFGRREMTTRIIEPGGAHIVYGGRQLGKSALLEQVRLRVHKPEARSFAVRIDIRPIGSEALGGPDAGEILFSEIVAQLKEAKFLPPKLRYESPQQAVAAILHQVEAEERSLLLLLDEADCFLDADARRDFEAVTRLRDAMTRSKGRFKVVLTGLHNVQRFQALANQPFAQLGSALLVGPLEPSAALQLIRVPFEALGYRFQDDGAIQHILSHTNYHPGLLQIFCFKLLAHLNQRHARELPFRVGEQDVEDVFQSQRELREEIRLRFEYTVTLDKRYEALAYALVLAQDPDDVGHSRAYSVAEFRRDAQYWWTKAFEGLRSEEVRSLLDEMVGLGLLARAGPNRFRLRSPNVVRLLGSREDIENKLQELAELPAPGAFRPDHHRPWLDRVETRCEASPFTLAQGRQLWNDESGVVLVTGCDATGISRVGAALRRFTEAATGSPPRSVLVETSLDVGGHARFANWLRDEVRRQPRSVERVLVCAPLSEALASTDFARAMDEELRRRQAAEARSPNVKVVLTLGPGALWRAIAGAEAIDGMFLQLPSITLRRISREGLSRLASDLEVPHDENSIRRLTATATGGWPLLVHEFLRTRGQLEIMAATEAFAKRTASATERDRLWQAFGVGGLPLVVSVLRTLQELGTPFESARDLEGLLMTDDVATAGPQLERVVEFLLRLDMLDRTPPVAPGRPGTLRLAPLVAEALPSLDPR